MRPITFFKEAIQDVLRRKKVATIDDLKRDLGSNTSKTVFRKLEELGYRTSYSHRGKFYTLDQIVNFDSQGLWSYQSIRFSLQGTLVKTVETFVEKSEQGYTSRELQEILKVEVKEPLLELYRKGCIDREELSDAYVYYSRNRTKARGQLQSRKDQQEYKPVRLGAPEPKVLAHELKAAIIIFFSLLDEKQRRLYAAVESMKYGHGGDQRIAELLEVSPQTVSRGRKELLNKEFEIQKVRKTGAGRKTVVKKNT